MFSKEELIHFENLSKTYRDGKKERIVLDNISGIIEKKTVNIIFGESGCGKTTFLSILAGIEEPDSGIVFFNDHNFYNLNKTYQSIIRGKHFGIVFQDFNLIDELTAHDNIVLPLIINRIPTDKKYYREIVNRMNLSKVENSYPNEMSGGEKQRTAIARAMITKPDIIFADEPTGNLDEENTKEVVRLLTDMNNLFGTTIVVVTHDKMLFNNPDKVFELHNGSIL